MLSRLIEQEQRGLLGESAGEDHALFFAAGKLVHPAIAQSFRAHLRKGVPGEKAIFLGFETEALSVRIAALQDVFPDAQGEEEFAFLLHEGDVLGASAEIERADFVVVHLNAARERLFQSGDETQEGGFAAGIGAENGDQFALAGLESWRDQE